MSEPKKRDRTTNFTCHETRTLVQLILKYGNTLENKRTDAVCWKDKEEAWKNLADEFNAEIGFCSRTIKILKTKYEAIKRNLRKKIASNNFEKYKKTGGGFAQPIHFSDYEMILMPLLSINVEGLPSLCDSDKGIL